MSKTLAIAINSRFCESGTYRLLERKLLEQDIRSSSFHWKNLKPDGTVLCPYIGGHKIDEFQLRDFDGVYISSLGPIGGDYSSKFENFLEILLEQPCFVINDPIIMRGNLDKGYLLDLQDSELPVIPTKELGDVQYEDFSELKNEFDSEDLVFKPRYFGERMRGVRRLKGFKGRDSFERYRKRYSGDLLIQAFLPEVNEGERSFVYVGKSLSHGILRVRSSWNENEGGVFRVVSPSDAEREVCERVFRILPSPFHVTRFDLIGGEENPRISEVERINPHLWTGIGFKEVDENFTSLLVPYVRERL